MARASKNKTRLGKSPKVLDKITDVEIQKVGEDGIDERTYLRSVGVEDTLIDKIILYPKWRRNYDMGKAKYDIAFQKEIMKAIKDGDTQLMKFLLTQKAETNEDEGKTVVTIRGKDFLK